MALLCGTDYVVMALSPTVWCCLWMTTSPFPPGHIASHAPQFVDHQTRLFFPTMP